MLKKLLKGILWLALLLAAAGFLFVWLGLGVNPLEGDADHLWDLVSNDVDFFARFPGTDVLREPVVEGLGEETGFEGIVQLKETLLRITRDAAREANPQIPLGLFEVDLDHDLRGKEVALGGLVRGDLSRPRLDSFVLLARIPPYAKFVSALARDFVRSKVPYGDRISLERGLYFKIKDPAIAEALAPFRSPRGRQEPDALWFARIRDVFLLTDEPTWIEHALKGGDLVLPADVDFKTEFIPQSVRRGDIELLLRPGLAGQFMTSLGRPDRNGTLYWVSRLVPFQMVGNVIVQATPDANGVALKLADHPLLDGYSRMSKPYLIKLYEREKADLRFDYTENGIGRLLPRRGVVGALVVHADADTLAALLMDALPEADRGNLDDVAAQAKGGGRTYPSYEALLAEIGKDLSDTHMVVIHRPAVFRTMDFSGADEIIDDAHPSAQPSFSLVSTVRDNVAPDKVVEKITQNLRYLGLKAVEDAQGKPMPLLHGSGKFYVVDPAAPVGQWNLLHPAYAALTEGGKFFVFTSSVENMEAILAAAKDPGARLLAEPGVAECAERLPQEGTLSLLARGGELRDILNDRVQAAFAQEKYIPDLEIEWAAKYQQQGIKDEDQIFRLVGEETERFKATEYPAFREEYRRRVAPLGALDTAFLGLSFGVGSTKAVTGAGYLLTRTASAAGTRSGD